MKRSKTVGLIVSALFLVSMLSMAAQANAQYVATNGCTQTTWGSCTFYAQDVDAAVDAEHGCYVGAYVDGTGPLVYEARVTPPGYWMIYINGEPFTAGYVYAGPARVGAGLLPAKSGDRVTLVLAHPDSPADFITAYQGGVDLGVKRRLCVA
jgi:hypothetical protein